MQFEAIASGFYLEALATDGDAVWFSDVAGGGLHRRSADGQIRSWFKDRPFIAALLPNDDGRILFSGPGGIAWLDPESGATGMLLDKIDGQPIPGANEMTPDRAGGIYFGVIDLVSIAAGKPPKPSALYRLHADGRVARLYDGLKFSNGLGLSPDGRTLYHNESFVGTFRHDVRADGSLGPATKLLENPDCDGLAVDREGGVWISGFGSSDLIRILPGGAIEKVPLPGDAATNVRLGGADGRTLYVNTVTRESVAAMKTGGKTDKPGSVLYRGRAATAGLPIERPRFRLK